MERYEVNDTYVIDRTNGIKHYRFTENRYLRESAEKRKNPQGDNSFMALQRFGHSVASEPEFVGFNDQTEIDSSINVHLKHTFGMATLYNPSAGGHQQAVEGPPVPVENLLAAPPQMLQQWVMAVYRAYTHPQMGSELRRWTKNFGLEASLQNFDGVNLPEAYKKVYAMFYDDWKFWKECGSLVFAQKAKQDAQKMAKQQQQQVAPQQQQQGGPQVQVAAPSQLEQQTNQENQPPANNGGGPMMQGNNIPQPGALTLQMTPYGPQVFMMAPNGMWQPTRVPDEVFQQMVQMYQQQQMMMQQQQMMNGNNNHHMNDGGNMKNTTGSSPMRGNLTNGMGLQSMQDMQSQVSMMALERLILKHKDTLENIYAKECATSLPAVVA
jgi:hypothetical protein